MATASRPSLELIVSLAVMAFSAVILVLSALSLFPVILGLLLTIGLTADLFWTGFGDPQENWRYMPLVALWFLAALPIAIHNTVVAVSTIDDPTPRAAAKLALLSIAILATCPVLWLGM